MPICNYDIGEITVLKDGSIEFPDGSDIIERLADTGITAEPEQTELTIEIPNTLTETELGALKQLIVSKVVLICKAVGAESLDITVSKNKVAFLGSRSQMATSARRPRPTLPLSRNW